MTRSIDIDQVLDDWLAEGPSRLPDRVVASITADIEHAAPSRRWRLPWRNHVYRNYFALAGAAVILIVAGGLAVSLLANRPGVAGPSPTPALTVAPSPSFAPTVAPSEVPNVTELLNGFLQARIAGTGAEEYLAVPESSSHFPPLLYQTTAGARYDRAEVEPVTGIEWPTVRSAYKVRLFAGDTVVEQLIFWAADFDPPKLFYNKFGYTTDIAPTTENGQPVASTYDYFGGQVTLRAAHPWVMSSSGVIGGGRLMPEGPGMPPTTDGGERTEWDQLILMADPEHIPFDEGCLSGTTAVDATSLADSIRSDPGLETTAPAAVTVGGADGVTMDVRRFSGASLCASVNEDGSFTDHWPVLYPIFADGWERNEFNGHYSYQSSGEWMRLYLLDVPEGSSMRILAIAVAAPRSTFDRAVEAAAPVLNSVEFHTP